MCVCGGGGVRKEERGHRFTEFLWKVLVVHGLSVGPRKDTWGVHRTADGMTGLCGTDMIIVKTQANSSVAVLLNSDCLK